MFKSFSVGLTLNHKLYLKLAICLNNTSVRKMPNQSWYGNSIKCTVKLYFVALRHFFVSCKRPYWHWRSYAQKTTITSVKRKMGRSQLKTKNMKIKKLKYSRLFKTLYFAVLIKLKSRKSNDCM